MLFDDTLLDDGQDDALIADRGERQAQHQIQLGGNPLTAQRGRFRFVPEPLHERRSQKFGVHERVVRLRPVQEGRLIPQQQLTDALTRGLRRAVEQVLDQQKVPDTDRFYISLASDRLRSASNAFHLTAQEWRQNGLRAQTLLDNLSKMLNSNEQFEMDDSFNLSVVHVRPPPRGTGKKRQHVPGHQSNVRLKQMKKSVIEMPRDDAGWCAARAIVTARGLSLAGQDTHARKQWIDPRRCIHRRQQAAEALAREVGLGPGAWGPDELTRVVMAPSLHDYKIVVVDASRAYSLVAYGHGDRLLALLYDDHHYDTLTSIKGFLGRSYLCSCVSKATITRDSIDVCGTKGNIAAVVCKRTAANTKPLIGPTARPTCCARNVNVTFTVLPVSNVIVRVPSTVDPKTKLIAPSVRRDGNARSVVLTYTGPKPSRIIVAGTRIVTLVNNTWTLNPINVSFKFGRWTTTTTCNRPSTCSLTLKPNKSIADTCPISWSASAPTTTSSIGGTVTRAFKSFCSNWKTDVKAVNNR